MILLTAPTALAQYVGDLEPDRPVSVEDARPVAFREFSASADWTYNKREEDLNDHGPGFSLLYGAARGLEVGAAIRYVTRPGRNSLRGISSGDLFLHGLYAIRGEDAAWPALAVRVAVQLPTGLESKGTDVHATGLATRSFESFRIHGNLHWTHIERTNAGERHERVEGIAGVDFPVGPRYSTDTLLVADASLRSNPVIAGTAIFTLEAGLRRRIGMRTILFAGVGSELTGEHRDRDRVRLRAGFTRAF